MCCIRKYSILIIFAVLILPLDAVADIEDDYFYGQDVLRSPKIMPCASIETKQECRKICGLDNYGCIFNECVCLKEVKEDRKKTSENIPQSKKEIRMLLHDIEDLVDGVHRYLLQKETYKQGTDLDVEEHPTLRHHIAHFCPNLGLARKCIHTCMKVGKPAFCGKDHLCYCGHRYSERDVDTPVNIADINNKFRDIYAKYFGPETTIPRGESFEEE